MAVDDLDALRAEAPDLFEDTDLPAGWEEDWAFVRVDKPEADLAAETLDFADDMDVLQSDRPRSSGGWEVDATAVPDFGAASFPGAPARRDSGLYVPPPDCLGFYLPFHYFHPVWWGIYLIPEGVEALANFVREQSGGLLTQHEAAHAAQLFVYGHEAFHHIVESFATRLEVSQRRPIYRRGFDELFRKYKGTPGCIEEALASAHGYRKVKDNKAFKQKHEKREAALEGLAEYIRQSPPAYNRALEFVQEADFVSERAAFAEENHNAALPEIPRLGSRVWHSFPHAFSGIGRVNSRVNYVIHRSSPLIERIRTRGHHLRYRDVAERLRRLASCTEARQKGSHVTWRNREGHTFTVPRHPGDLKKGTLRSIIRGAGLQMTLSEFVSKRP